MAPSQQKRLSGERLSHPAASDLPGNVAEEGLDVSLHRRLGAVRIVLADGFDNGGVFVADPLVLLVGAQRDEPQAQRALVQIAQQFDEDGVARSAREQRMEFAVEKHQVLDVTPLGRLDHALEVALERLDVAVGRALVTNPRVLILDEATEGLAPLIRDEIWRTIRLVREAGIATLVVDKSVADVAAVADRVVVLVKGQIAFEGHPATLTGNAELMRQHLGV